MLTWPYAYNADLFASRTQNWRGSKECICASRQSWPVKVLPTMLINLCRSWTGTALTQCINLHTATAMETK